MAKQAAPARPHPERVAACWHTGVRLLGLSYFGFRSLLSSHPVAPVDASIADAHASQIGKYLFIIATEIGTAAWVWAGVQWKSGSFRRRIGGRWDNWRTIAGDVAIALVYWVVWGRRRAVGSLGCGSVTRGAGTVSGADWLRRNLPVDDRVAHGGFQ